MEEKLNNEKLIEIKQDYQNFLGRISKKRILLEKVYNYTKKGYLSELIQEELANIARECPTFSYNTIIEDYLTICFDKAEGYAAKKVMSSIIKNQPEFASEIAEGIASACYSRDRMDFAVDIISGSIKQNPDVAFNIIENFIVNCFFSEDIKKKTKFTMNLISKILYRNPNLADRTYFTFSKYINLYKGRSMLEILKVLNSILTKSSSKGLKKLVEQYAVMIFSDYLVSSFFRLKKDNSLSKCDRDESCERQICMLLKKCDIIGSNIETFEDITIDSLIGKWTQFFNNKIQFNSIDSGRLSEIVMYILKDFAEGKPIKYLFDNERFKNFYYIKKSSMYGARQFELLRNKSLDDSSISIVYTANKSHAIICIIKGGAVKAIDSSYASEGPFAVNYFNRSSYQENRTCYINAGLAFKIILDLSKYNRLDNVIGYLGKVENGQQNIITKLSDEIVKLYEILGQDKNSQFKLTSDDIRSIKQEQVVSPQLSPRSSFSFSPIPEKVSLPSFTQEPILPNISEFKEAVIPSIPLMRVSPSFSESEQALLSEHLPINQNKENAEKQVQPLKKIVKQLKIDYKNFIIVKKYLIQAFEASNYKVQCEEINKDGNQVIDKIIARKEEFVPDDTALAIDKNAVSQGRVAKKTIVRSKQERRHPALSVKGHERASDKNQGVIHLTKKDCKNIMGL